MDISGVWRTILLTVFVSTAVGCGESEPGTPESGDGTPVVMTQLLRFNERAEGTEEDLSGSEAFGRYSASLLVAVEERGGRLLWSGSAGPLVIGESRAPFHEIVVVEYPSEQAYLDVMADHRVVDREDYRQAGLECQWLVPGRTYY